MRNSSRTGFNPVRRMSSRRRKRSESSKGPSRHQHKPGVAWRKAALALPKTRRIWDPTESDWHQLSPGQRCHCPPLANPKPPAAHAPISITGGHRQGAPAARAVGIYPYPTPDWCLESRKGRRKSPPHTLPCSHLRASPRGTAKRATKPPWVGCTWRSRYPSLKAMPMAAAKRRRALEASFAAEL